MARLPIIGCLVAILVANGISTLFAQSDSSSPPTTYELLINGESFLVEANQQTKLTSRQKPGVVYDIALRVAPQQRLALNTIQFEYDLPARVDDDHGPPKHARAVRLRHELGYTILMTDLGGPIEEGDRAKALDALRDSVATSLKSSGMETAEPPKPQATEFTHCVGRGYLLRYRDVQGNLQTCLVYLLCGKSFAASCIVQYLDADAETVRTRVKQVLDSVRSLR